MEMTLVICSIIIWLAPWASILIQFLRCDLLPEQARWRYLARSGIMDSFPQKKLVFIACKKSSVDLTLASSSSFFLRGYGPRLGLVS